MRELPERLSALPEPAATEHRAWRSRQLAILRQVRVFVGGANRRRAVERLDALEAEILEVTTLLAKAHGTPDLGNKKDPVDELVYITLSRRTREGAYKAAYEVLRRRFSSWDAVAAAPLAEIEDAVAFSGLGTRKAQSLKFALGDLIERFGTCTLEPTRSWSDDELAGFLCTLPEVGPKSAACIMMCSLDRPAFPVDAHVGRVLMRLGTFQPLGIELTGTDHKAKQTLLWDAVPPSLRYPLHVNALVHGRVVCLPRRPRCRRCDLSSRCAFASGARGGLRRKRRGLAARSSRPAK